LFLLDRNIALYGYFFQALKELKAKASSKGAFGGAGLKKSGGSGKK
jgi:hypothetical protein